MNRRAFVVALAGGVHQKLYAVVQVDLDRAAETSFHVKSYHGDYQLAMTEAKKWDEEESHPFHWD